MNFVKCIELIHLRLRVFYGGIMNLRAVDICVKQKMFVGGGQNTSSEDVERVKNSKKCKEINCFQELDIPQPTTWLVLRYNLCYKVNKLQSLLELRPRDNKYRSFFTCSTLWKWMAFAPTCC